MQNKETLLICLGGSIIVPREGEIDVEFLKSFRKLILDFIKKGNKFIIVTGGGKTCRIYQTAASKIIKLPYEDQDWLGIHATRINAHLLRTIFRNQSCSIVLDNPFKKIKKAELEKPIIIASGWKPGWSTDYIAVLLTKRFKCQKIIKTSNISYLYNSNPRLNKKAKPIKEISWADLQKLVSRKWMPGLHTPFDPVAIKMAKKLKLKAIIIKGTDLKNLKKVFDGKEFSGTIIEK